MASNSSTLVSPSTWCRLSWLHTAKSFFLLTIFYTTMISCSNTDTPYNKHCALVVHQSTPDAVPQFATIPFSPKQDGYFLGGEEILNHPKFRNSSQYYYPSSNKRVLIFDTHSVYSTDADDVYKVEGSLILKTSDMDYYVGDGSSRMGPLNFELQGFWSKSTGKLCMVGSASTYSEEGQRHVLAALLKLDGVGSSSNITSVVRGVLESLSPSGDSGYFKPISVLMLPQINYEYTEVGNALDHVCTGGIDVPRSSSLGITVGSPICSAFSHPDQAFKLEYSSGCKSTKSCNPFGESAGYLPQIMYLRLIQCSENKKKLRFLIEFSNNSYVDYYRPFTLNTTWVAEGAWDVNKNRLCVVACSILNSTLSLNNSHIEDCSVRLSFRFPAVWSIRNTSGILGHIWSKKLANVSGYFNRIMFRSYEDYVAGIPGLKYNYTVVDKARKSCPHNHQTKNKGKWYPDANLNEMLFNMAIRNSKGRRIGWGFSEPISVGDQIARRNNYVMSWSSSRTANSPVESKTNRSVPMNISYKMNFPMNDEAIQVQTSAEGIYDAETGILCMAGCRYLDSKDRSPDNDPMECEILINIQFPPVDSNDFISGHIESTRKKSTDPLYFEPLTFTAVSYYSHHSRESIWRLDLEIIMALISNTLACFFVGHQILYVKKHPSVFPFISLLMLLVLALGYMVPLMLNFEALLLPKRDNATFLLRTGRWLEVNEVIIRVVSMVAFLLQFRLLHLVWSARVKDEKQKASWVAEKRVLSVSLPLYICGGLTILFVNWRNNKLGESMQFTYIRRNQHFLWVDIGTYAGLVLDGFLLPQIILNIFQNSTEKALSRFFYIGTTLVRLLPHAYDLYRAYYYVEDFDGSYIYAKPGGDYYSIAWDVAIPIVGVLFALIIHLQQCFGGHCLMPKRFKKLQVYEKYQWLVMMHDLWLQAHTILITLSPLSVWLHCAPFCLQVWNNYFPG